MASARAPPRRVEAEAMRKTEDDAGERGRHIPIREVEYQQPSDLEINRFLHVERREPVGLERREHAEECRDDEYPAYGRGPGSVHQFHYPVCLSARQGKSDRLWDELILADPWKLAVQAVR